MAYNCKKLLEYTGGSPYYDTVIVVVGDSKQEQDVIFEYLVICDADRLKAFDINFLVLFAIAIAIVIAAIKTP